MIDSEEARQKAGLGSGPSASDVQKIQQRMLGPEVLDAQRYPRIQFTTMSVENSGPGDLRVTGNFELHGRTKQVTVPVRYKHFETGGFGFYGDLKIRQTDFGLEPQTVAGRTVKVKDEVTIRFQVTIVPAS